MKKLFTLLSLSALVMFAVSCGDKKDGGDDGNGGGTTLEINAANLAGTWEVDIEHDFAQGYQIEYVLGKFPTDEMKATIQPAIDKAVEMVLSFTTAGLQRTMSQFNTPKKKPTPTPDTDEK